MMKSYFEAIRLTLIMLGAKMWNIDETRIVLDHKPMKVLPSSDIKSQQSRSSETKNCWWREVFNRYG